MNLENSNHINSRPVIVARGLRKSFGSFEAVSGIDFKINAGECFGFLGPNGAGKTSTMRMIYCFSPVSGGDLSVFDLPVQTGAREIKARLGVVPQDDNLDSYLTVEENLRLYAHYFDLPKIEIKHRVEELLEFFSLTEKRKKQMKELSGGMRRRLLIARALINRPDLLVLDEPTTGLDPQARHMIWQKLRALKSAGVSMVLTTHYMEEASQLCDRLVLMERGAIHAQGAPSDLIRQYVGQEVIEVRGTLPVLKDLSEKIVASSHFKSEGQPQVVAELVGDILFLWLRAAGQALWEKLWQEFPQLQQLDFRRRPATLEDVFLKLTGRELHD